MLRFSQLFVQTAFFRVKDELLDSSSPGNVRYQIYNWINCVEGVFREQTCFDFHAKMHWAVHWSTGPLRIRWQMDQTLTQLVQSFKNVVHPPQLPPLQPQMTFVGNWAVKRSLHPLTPRPFPRGEFIDYSDSSPLPRSVSLPSMV